MICLKPCFMKLGCKKGMNKFPLDSEMLIARGRRNAWVQSASPGAAAAAAKTGTERN